MSTASDHDIRCSNACTRAGPAILLLSAVAIAMFQPLEKKKQLDAVVSYVLLRVNLQEELNSLQNDPVWRHLTTSEHGEKAKTEWTLDHLLQYKMRTIVRDKLTTSHVLPSETRSGAPTLKLKEFFYDREIAPLHSIASALEWLANGDLLTKARQYSYQYNLSIYRWVQLRTDLRTEEISTLIKKAQAEYIDSSRFYRRPEISTPDVPTISREQLFSTLRYRSVESLIGYEPPKQAEADALLKDQANLALPSMGLLVPLAPAATFVEISLLLLVLYFWLYYREAKASASFLAPATLFGVFARTRLSRLIFNLLLLVPPVAAALLAEKSFSISPGNVAPAVVVILISSIIVGEGTPTNK